MITLLPVIWGIGRVTVGLPQRADGRRRPIRFGASLPLLPACGTNESVSVAIKEGKL